MSGFESSLSDAFPEAVPPPRVVVMPVSGFAPSWGMRPECDCRIGIRLPSQEDTETIEVEAMKDMREAYASGEDAAVLAYNQSKLLNLVAMCICSPEDVTLPHELFPAPNATLPSALTPKAIRRLFDEIERLQIDTSPIFLEATDEEVATLRELLGTSRLGNLSTSDPVNHSRIRRYVAFCLELLS